MNTEQAIKHKEVIKWWLDNTDKGMWVKYDNIWSETKTPSWNINYKYVQNDEYAEFRKAEVEGKQLQYKRYFYTDWRDCETSHVVFCQQSAEYYRIKPAEPKFKVGNWVRSGFDNSIYQLTEDNWSEDVELWQPQEGDVVVCIDNNEDIKHIDECWYSTVHKKLCIGGGKPLNEYDNLIPYIGQDFKEMK